MEDILLGLLAVVVGAVFCFRGYFAYLYYEVAVFIGMTSIGFVLGTGAMAFLGITWSWLVILVGVITAAVLAVVAIVGDMPMVLLTVLTALAGATVVTTGLMLLTGAVDIADFDSAATTEGVNDDWWWYATYIALAIVGAISQFRANEVREDTLRAAWRGVGEPASLH